jgi:hypothetical protein
VDFPRLAALLAAAAAPCEAGPQSGEAFVVDAFHDLVVEAAGTPSLAARRNRRRMAVVAATSTVVMLGSGIAAAAGSLPGAAQSTAQTVLGVIGVSVPGPNGHAGSHPNERGRSGDPHGPATAPGQSDHPTPPAGVGTPPTPGNSDVSRHHGNPTPAATDQPTPGHGQPSAAPTVAHHRATPPTHAPASPAVMHRFRPAISR